MKSLTIRTVIVGCAVLALASFYQYHAPRAKAANGPFNSKIAFVRNECCDGQIFLMNSDGTGQVDLSTAGNRDSNPAWSPSGKQIAFSSKRNFPNSQIWVMNADGSDVRQLTTSTSDDQPAWSPDGEKIAFRRFSAREIWVMNKDGSGQQRLATEADGDPAWSPDGRKIAFDARRDINPDIYVMNADGSGQTRLTRNGDNNQFFDESPSWSPDGRKIAFSRVGGVPGHGIFLMNPDGSNQTLIPNAAFGDNPAFSPDGTKLTFSDFDDVYSINIDGTALTRLTSNTAPEEKPSWQPFFSPMTIGVFRPSTGQWLLRNSNTSGSPDIILTFGKLGDLPVTGDWNGDGRTDIGVFRNGTFFLATLKTIYVRACILCVPIPQTSFDTLPSFTFGQAGDLPIAGDWNRDGIYDVGVFRNGTFILRQPGVALNSSFTFGQAGDKPVVGDWNGDTFVGVGVFRGGEWFLRNSTSAGAADIQVEQFGTLAGVLPLVGDWNGDGKDTIGLLFNGSFFFRNTNTNGPDSDLIFSSFAQAGDLPVAGDWDGPNSPPNSGINDPATGSSSVGQPQLFTTTCSDPDGWHDISTIDFKIARSDGNANGVPLALWVQFDEGSNLIRFYDPDTQTWQEGEPGSNVVLSSRFADLFLSSTQVQGSGPNGISVQVTWAIAFKDSAIMNKYKQYLKITDDAGLTTGFDKVGSWSITR